MSKKYWEQTDNGAWYLHFNPYDCEDTVVLKMVRKDEDNDCWIYVSELLNTEDDYFYEDNLEDAKWYAEHMISEYYKDQANYYEELVERFEEE